MILNIKIIPDLSAHVFMLIPLRPLLKREDPPDTFGLSKQFPKAQTDPSIRITLD